MGLPNANFHSPMQRRGQNMEIAIGLQQYVDKMLYTH